MIYDNVKAQFGKWDRFFRNYIESSEMDQLFGYIKKRATVNKVLPESSRVFRCFADTDPDNLRVIICGIAPYHTTYSKGKDKVPIADGLALSCSSTWQDKGLQPSMDQIYGSFENDYSNGFDPDMYKTGDLSYLAEQGVLLYNISLTVEENRPLSMNSAWESFNRFFFTEVINKYFRGLPIIFLGAQAHKSASLLTPMLHYPFLISHPASASYNNTQWSSEGVWQKVDDILWQNNKTKIKWFLKKNEDKIEYPDWVTNTRTSSDFKQSPAGGVTDLPFDI